MTKAELIFLSIIKAAPDYKPCLACKHSFFKPISHRGWCKNVPAGLPPKPVDEVGTCEAWEKK